MPPPHCGCAITESTYGDCGHKQKEFIKCAGAKAREEAYAQTNTQRNRSYTTPTASFNTSKASRFLNNIAHTMRTNFKLGVNPKHVESPPPTYIKPCDAPEMGFKGSRSGICDMCKRENARRRAEKIRYDVHNEIMENEESEILFGGHGRARPRAFTDVPRVAAQNNNQNIRNQGQSSRNPIPSRVPSHPPPTIGLVSRNANVNNNRKRTNPIIQNQNYNQVRTASALGTGMDLTMLIEPPMVYQSNSARQPSRSPPLHHKPSRRRELSRSPLRSPPRTPPSKPLPNPSTRPSKFTGYSDSSREHFNFDTTDLDENNVAPISPLASESQTFHLYPYSVPEVFRVNRERRRAEREREEREERERGEIARRGRI